MAGLLVASRVDVPLASELEKTAFVSSTAITTPSSSAPSSPALSATALTDSDDDAHSALLDSPPSTTASSPDIPDATTLDLSLTHFQTSPYPFPENFTSTSAFTPRTHLLTHALTFLHPLDPSYATNPSYLATFNFGSVFALLRQLLAVKGLKWERTEYHVVIFRSVLNEGVDRDLLGELDRKAHEEASESGGLLRYWFGSCDSERRNLATCIWRHRSDAIAGGKGPWHAKCRLAARTMYERISFHSHRLVVDEDVRDWWLEDL